MCDFLYKGKKFRKRSYIKEIEKSERIITRNTRRKNKECSEKVDESFMNMRKKSKYVKKRV